MRTDRFATAVLMLLSVLFVGGCGTLDSGGPSSGPSVSIGTRSTSIDKAPTRTARPLTPTRRAAAPTVTTRPQAIRPTVTTRATTPSASYTQEEIAYFIEVALGSEYGDSEQTVKKWAEDIRIEVLGEPAEEDLQTLHDVVVEINSLIDGVKMVLVEQSPNVELHFAQEDEFGSIEPNYVQGNNGFFWSYWTANDELYESRILISTDEITQAERSHLIREEVTQVLGLMNDSDRYEESIFFEGWTETSSYSKLDKSVIEMLYREDVDPGMTAKEVIEVLEKPR
jgi:hypothetical protein